MRLRCGKTSLILSVPKSSPSNYPRTEYTTALACISFGALIVPVHLPSAEIGVSIGLGSFNDNLLGVRERTVLDLVPSSLQPLFDPHINHHIIDSPISTWRVTLSSGIRIGARYYTSVSRYIGHELAYSGQFGRLRASHVWDEYVATSALHSFTGTLRSLRIDPDISTLTDYWTSELQDHVIENTFDISSDSHHIYYNPLFHLRAPRGNTVSPFITGGVGLSVFWANLNDLQNVLNRSNSLPALIPFSVNIGYSYGGGLKYDWSKYGLRIDVRYYVMIKQVYTPRAVRQLVSSIAVNDNLEASVTVSFRTGHRQE